MTIEICFLLSCTGRCKAENTLKRPYFGLASKVWTTFFCSRFVMRLYFFQQVTLGANLLWRTKKNSVHMSPSIFRYCFSRKNCFVLVTLFARPFYAVELRCISTFFNRRQIGANLLWRNKQKSDKYRHSISRINRTRPLCHLLFCAARPAVR